MQEILFNYRLNPTTWAYISALMMIGIYFKFSRFWSVRNLDLVVLIGFSPAFLLMYHGLIRQMPELVQGGFVWLFVVGTIFLVRLLLDTLMVRRPLLEPNLSAAGLTFTGTSLLVFLMANVITSPPERMESLFLRQSVTTHPSPGYELFYKFAALSNEAIIPVEEGQSPTLRQTSIRAATARTAAILAHLAIVTGMVLIGIRHFDNVHTGVAAATLYLLTFYTSQFTSLVDHVAPAMFLVWAVAAYRLPILSGILLGFAAGMIYYPLFLLPLWCSFYLRRGIVRFVFGVVLSLTILVCFLFFNASNFSDFLGQLQLMFGWRNPMNVTVSGFWQYYRPEYRIPVLAAFAVICFSMAIWPAQKNLGTLLSCSAAIMLGVQFWHANYGGVYMAWYLPLLILTIFRPNLEDRVALSAVRPMWWKKT